MNDANSKKQTVERFIKMIYPDMTELAIAANTEDSCLRDATTLIKGLQAKVKEQDQEIKKVREELNECRSKVAQMAVEKRYGQRHNG